VRGARDGHMNARYRVSVIPTVSIRLTTQRLVLRAPKTSDVGELRRLLRHNHAHLAPWNPLPRSDEDPTSLTEVTSSVLAQRRDWKLGRAFSFLVTSRAEPSRLLGKIALTGILRGAFHGAYLGYWIDVDHQGAGICTEGIRAVLDFAFGPAGLHRVQAAIMPSNPKSLRVIEKLGFRREGYAERYLHIAGKWEDHLLFAHTSEEHAAAAQTAHLDALT
jgi:ribosomal-protein-alanine N-acetyltransferase